ncbi:MAG: hypothetical protein GX225_00855 [Clostridiales bacterium]|nr:hypothetical protein [Clostridiales bacterium]
MDEKKVNNAKDKDICDNIIFINPRTGYKITEYIEGARSCDPLNEEDVRKYKKEGQTNASCRASYNNGGRFWQPNEAGYGYDT